METVNPVQVQQYLSGMTYPAQRDQLVSHASNQGADEDTIALLESLPAREYSDPTDVSAALAEARLGTVDRPQPAPMQTLEPGPTSPQLPQPAQPAAPPAAPSGPTSRTASRVQQLATSQLNSQKGKAAELLQSAGSAIRQAGQTMREQGQEQIAQFTDTGAEKVDSLSSYLRETDAEEIVARAQQTARKQPLIIMGAGFALAFAAARVLKATLAQPSASPPEPEVETTAGAEPPPAAGEPTAETPRRRRRRTQPPAEQPA